MRTRSLGLSRCAGGRRAPGRACGGRASSSTRPRAARRAASRQRSRIAVSSRSIPSMSSGATTTPAPVSRISVGGSAVGRDDREDRALGGEVLEHLPREHAAAAAVGLGDQEQQRLGVALELERHGGAGRTGSSSMRSMIPAAHSRSAARKSPTKRATTPSTRASAVRNGRGSRLPKNEPACVIRNRSAATVLEPGEVLEVGAVRDRHHRRRAGCARASPSAIASETATIASACRATSEATACDALLLDADRELRRVAVRMRDDASRGGPRPSARRSRASPRRR